MKAKKRDHIELFLKCIEDHINNPAYIQQDIESIRKIINEKKEEKTNE